MTSGDYDYAIPTEIGPVISEATGPASGRHDQVVSGSVSNPFTSPLDPWHARALLAQHLVSSLPVFSISALLVSLPMMLAVLVFGANFIGNLAGIAWFLCVLIGGIGLLLWGRRGGISELRTHIRAVWKFAPMIYARDMSASVRVLVRWDKIAQRAGLEEVERTGGSTGQTLAKIGGLGGFVEKRFAPQLVAMWSTPLGLVVDLGVPLGVAPRRYMDCDMWGAAFAVPVRAEVSPALDGRTVVRLLLETGEDPLKSMIPLDEPMPITDWEAVPVGLHQDGSTAVMSLREVSGLVVGGLPGGGKTAALTSMLSSLAVLDCVQFSVFDGKGGADWSWIAPRASVYNPNDEDRETVAKQLEALEQTMRVRLRELPKIRGGSSIWTTGGPSRDLPLLVAVVDESQAYLDASMIPKSDKEAQAVRQRIETAIASLVRKGRSAGVLVLLATQKPTSDSLPTTIGANAARAIGFRVKTPEAERAIFGTSPAEGQPSAAQLPAIPGYAVVSSEDGAREIVRFFYLPENIANHYARNLQHLRGAVIDQGPAESSATDAAGLDPVE